MTAAMFWGIFGLSILLSAITWCGIAVTNRALAHIVSVVELYRNLWFDIRSLREETRRLREEIRRLKEEPKASAQIPPAEAKHFDPSRIWSDQE